MARFGNHDVHTCETPQHCDGGPAVAELCSSTGPSARTRRGAVLPSGLRNVSPPPPVTPLSPRCDALAPAVVALGGRSWSLPHARVLGLFPPDPDRRPAGRGGP